MPNGFRPRSSPASISASKMWFWYSSPWCSSQPSSPTKLTRSALVGARPTMISRPVSQGNAAFEKSASLTRCSSSRALGPATTSTPIALVRFFELDRAVVRHVLREPVVVEALPGAGRDQIEAVRRLAHDRELGVHAAPRVQRMAQVHAARSSAAGGWRPGGRGTPRRRGRRPAPWRTRSCRAGRRSPRRSGTRRRRARTSASGGTTSGPPAARPWARTSSAAPSRTSGRTPRPAPSSGRSTAPCAAAAPAGRSSSG